MSLSSSLSLLLAVLKILPYIKKWVSLFILVAVLLTLWFRLTKLGARVFEAYRRFLPNAEVFKEFVTLWVVLLILEELVDL